MDVNNEKKVDGVMESHDINEHHTRRGSNFGEKIRDSISVQHVPEGAIEGQIFSMNDVDPALDAKMRLVNQVTHFLHA